MEDKNKESYEKEVFNKWKSLIEDSTISDDKSEWLSEYTQNHINNENNLIHSNDIDDSSNTFDQHLFPIATYVASQTVASDLVSVEPMSVLSNEKIKEIKNQLLVENRDGAIDFLENGKDFKYKVLEDTEEYKNSIPSSNLIYLDYVYDNYSDGTNIDDEEL